MENNRKRWVWGLFSAVLVWIGINLVLVAGVIIDVGNLGESIDDLDISRTKMVAQRLDTWLEVLYWSSLRLVKFPYASELYELATISVELVLEGVEIAEEGKVLLGNSLAGIEINQNDLGQWLAGVSRLVSELESLSDSISSERVEKLARVTGNTEGLNRAQRRVETGLRLSEQMNKLMPAVPMMLGFGGEKHYVLLFQNNMELRPTGGFLGSYGDVWFENGAMSSFEIQDIYVPDGQIKGYVKEPDPIREYLFRGDTPGWRLRDSNWNPDFPQSALVMDWFFTEGKLAPIDGIIAINLIPVLDMLEITGPIQVLDYDEEVSADNFYQIAQTQTEIGFFPGSTQKGDFLSAVGRQLMRTVVEDVNFPREQLIPIVWKHIASKQIMVALFDEPAASVMSSLGWDGDLVPVGCDHENPGCVADYIHLNEANLGINKTNCCLDRAVSDEIVFGDGEIEHRLSIKFTNHNPPTPDVPRFWGGGYHNYQRLFVPKNSRVIKVSQDSEIIPPELVDIEEVEDKLSIGFLVGVGGGRTSQIEVVYAIPYEPSNTFEEYQQIIQKQSGIESIPWVTRISSNTDNVYELVLSEDNIESNNGEVVFDLEKDSRLIVLIAE